MVRHLGRSGLVPAIRRVKCQRPVRAASESGPLILGFSGVCDGKNIFQLNTLLPGHIEPREIVRVFCQFGSRGGCAEVFGRRGRFGPVIWSWFQAGRSGLGVRDLSLLSYDIRQFPAAFEPAFGWSIKPEQQEEVFASRYPVVFHSFWRLWCKEDIC